MRTVKGRLKLLTTTLVFLSIVGIKHAHGKKGDDQPEPSIISTTITVKQEHDQTDAQAEHKEAVRLYALGLMHFHGHGVPENQWKAAEYFQQAANKNHKDAMHRLAHMHAKGQGIPVDMAKFRQNHIQNCQQDALTKSRARSCFF